MYIMFLVNLSLKITTNSSPERHGPGREPRGHELAEEGGDVAGEWDVVDDVLGRDQDGLVDEGAGAVEGAEDCGSTEGAGVRVAHVAVGHMSQWRVMQAHSWCYTYLISYQKCIYYLLISSIIIAPRHTCEVVPGAHEPVVLGEPLGEEPRHGHGAEGPADEALPRLGGRQLRGWKWKRRWV